MRGRFEALPLLPPLPLASLSLPLPRPLLLSFPRMYAGPSAAEPSAYDITAEVAPGCPSPVDHTPAAVTPSWPPLPGWVVRGLPARVAVGVPPKEALGVWSEEGVGLKGSAEDGECQEGSRGVGLKGSRGAASTVSGASLTWGGGGVRYGEYE